MPSGPRHAPGPLAGDFKIDANLLNELRIQRTERDDHGGPPRWLWIALAVVAIVAFLAAGGWWAWASRPVTVQVATATAPAGGAGAAGAVLQATGYVTPRRRATVSTQITGTLTQVLIEEGDHVQKGQLLARLEDSALRAGLDAARANLASAKAQIASAQAQLAQAQSDERRQVELLASGMVTKAAGDQARTAVATALAQLDARRREADAAAAQLGQAQVNFDYSVVRAPFAGVVTEKAAQVGEIVSPLSAGGGFTRTGVGTIVDMDSLEVEVDVAEAYIGQVQPDMRAEAVLDAYPDWKIPAHVIAVIPAADRGKGTVKVRVALEQKDARLVPDIGVRVTFLARKDPAAPAQAQAARGALVPASAVVQRDGHAAVFTVADGKAVLHAVTPVTPDIGTMKSIPAGISAGDRVVLSPPEALQDGAAVKVEDASH